MTLAEQIDRIGETALEIKAQRDRYEKALREIAGEPGAATEDFECIYCDQTDDDHLEDCPISIAQEALRCE